MLRTLLRHSRRYLGPQHQLLHTSTPPASSARLFRRSSQPSCPQPIPIAFRHQSAQASSSSASSGGVSTSDDDLDLAAAGDVDALDNLEEDLELLQCSEHGDMAAASAADDLLLAELTKSTSIEQVLHFLDQHVDSLSQQQLIRTVLVLWDHHKSDYYPRPPPASIATGLAIRSAPFERLLAAIEACVPTMSPDELTICLLYLGKIGARCRQSRCMQSLLDTCIDRLRDPLVHFPLTALSRFAVSLNAFKDIYTFFVCQDAYARMLHSLETVATAEELRLLTIGLNSLHQLVSRDTLDTYKSRVRQLLDDGSLSAEKVKCLLKCIQFLNYPHWSQRNTALLRELVLLLGDRIEALQVSELEQMFRVFQSQLEPAELTAKLTAQAHALFERTPTAELLACSVMYALPEKRARLTEYAREFIYSRQPEAAAAAATPLSTLFKILRYLKISDVHICDEYWSKVMHEIRDNPLEQQSYVLARHCHRYMHFNNNLGGTYHHVEFEKYVTGLLVDEMRTGITAVIPGKFAKVAAFIIAYGHTPNGRQQLPEFVVGRIEAMGGQFKIVDCLQISRGIQIALQMRFKRHLTAELAAQLRRIEVVLNGCTERHLRLEELSLSQLNAILRAYTNRQTSTRTPLFHQIMHKYTEIPHQLNSRAIREITFNLYASRYLIPSVCASLVQYVIANRDYVMGDTVEKVLTCCYNLGYIPDGDEVLDAALHIINRDFDYMSGLSIVQACLAMNFYHTLPESLINRVFNIEFIKRLEDEIEMCYSKATYPERVLNQVMQLNRAVCLDCPAAGVPWFQQNYIEAQMSKLPVVKSKFNDDVRSMLVAHLKDQQLLKVDHVTPYGYRIDFVLHFDGHRNPVPPARLDGPNPQQQQQQQQQQQPGLRNNSSLSSIHESINKVAILLLKLDAFCHNDVTRLRGPEILRNRHLEMLGYKVVQVHYSEWNAMYMSVPGAKMNYLKSLLEIERPEDGESANCV